MASEKKFWGIEVKWKNGNIQYGWFTIDMPQGPLMNLIIGNYRRDVAPFAKKWREYDVIESAKPIKINIEMFK